MGGVYVTMDEKIEAARAENFLPRIHVPLRKKVDKTIEKLKMDAFSQDGLNRTEISSPSCYGGCSTHNPHFAELCLRLNYRVDCPTNKRFGGAQK